MLTTTTHYQEFLKALNPAQHTAATTIEGPVLVVAGPGTGKTQVLVARIAHILQQTDTKPGAILALTFTESAAKNMRERLVQLIGNTAYAVRICTFHAFCKEVLDAHPEYFPLARESEPISDLERYEILQDAIARLPLKRLRPIGDPFCFLRDIIKGISELKREGVLPEQLASLAATQLVEAKAVEVEWQRQTDNGRKRVKGAISKNTVKESLREAEKMTELALIYADFQAKLAENKRFDFEDMISLVVRAFREEEELLLEYQENLHYFLVDEYQDTNSAQDALLDILASYWESEANVFVVGDPNQAIYRFQGASVENMLGFVERYPNAVVVTLSEAYRCPQSFYDAATQLISANNLQLTTKAFSLSPQLQSHNQAKTLINFAKIPTQQLEAVFIAEHIQSLIESGVKRSKIAVLYRNNYDRNELAETLYKWQIRFEIEGGTDVLGSETIEQLLTLFRAILQIRQADLGEALFQSLLFGWARVDRLTVMQLARTASHLKKSLMSVIEMPFAELQLSSKELGISIDEQSFAGVKERYLLMISWGADDSEKSFPQWFEEVINESSFLKYIQSRPDSAEQLLLVTTLFEQIKGMAQANHALELTDFVQTVTTFQTHKLQMRSEDQHLETDAVCLSTVHKAKGREWDHVFVLGLVDKKWGESRDQSKLHLPTSLLAHTQVTAKDRNEDDRRLFYVAVTRARQTLWLTHPERVIKNGRSDEKTPSQFIAELGQEKLQTIDTSVLTNKATEYMSRLISPPPVLVTAEGEREEKRRAYFAKLVNNFKLSPTALNTYLKDPTEFVMNNLLRVPRAKAEPMAFGTAIHTALEKHFRLLKNHGKFPELEETLTTFEKALSQEILTPEVFARRLIHGKEILIAFLQSIQSMPAVYEIEKGFGTSSSPVMLGNIVLSGRIDRIDWADDSHDEVVVVDYKTGRPKTSNEIAGLTKSADLSEYELALNLPDTIRGPYKRQLLFYKLLTKQDKSFAQEVTRGKFEFIEPDRTSGKTIVREFVLPDSEVDELADLIIVVMKQLRNLEFLSLLDEHLG